MALEQKQKKPARKPLVIEPEKSDWVALIESIQRNPVLWATGVAFVFVCAIAGLMYRAHAASSSKAVTTEYLRALDTEDPALQLAALEQIKGAKGDLAVEILYMTAEAAYRAKDYDKAKALFEQVRAESPNSPFAPDAVEGLGYIAESKDDYQAALALYQEIQTKWGQSFTARRQSMNIGRCQEHLGKLQEAVLAYEEQDTSFPESAVGRDAKDALERLRKTHPELFPAEEASAAPAAAAAPGVEAPAAGAPAAAAEPAPAAPAAEAPAEPPTPKLQLKVNPDGAAPAAEAPAAEAPAAEAPAEESAEETPEGAADTDTSKSLTIPSEAPKEGAEAPKGQ